MNHLLSHESKPTYGFTLAAGNLVIRLGYKVEGNLVTLFATTQVASNPPQMWRQFQAPKASAVEAAHNLAGEACDYAESTGGLIRPYEDLDLDDFIEHLTLTVQGEMN